MEGIGVVVCDDCYVGGGIGYMWFDCEYIVKFRDWIDLEVFGVVDDYGFKLFFCFEMNCG